MSPLPCCYTSYKQKGSCLGFVYSKSCNSELVNIKMFFMLDVINLSSGKHSLSMHISSKTCLFFMFAFFSLKCKILVDVYFLGSNDQGRTQGKNWLELLTSAPFTMKRHRQKKPKHSICLHPSSLKPYRIALKYQVETMSKRGKVRRKKYPRRGEDILHGENQS